MMPICYKCSYVYKLFFKLRSQRKKVTVRLPWWEENMNVQCLQNYAEKKQMKGNLSLSLIGNGLDGISNESPIA